MRIDFAEGTQFGLWIVLGEGLRRGKQRYWRVQCRCGAIGEVSTHQLKERLSKSCSKCKTTTHGDSGSAEYRTWASMRSRAGYAKANSEISLEVCARWDSYAAFLYDMGRKPTPKHSLDRIIPSGPYSPDNCRWATYQQQSENRSITRYIEFRGDRKSITEWSSLTGTHADTLRRRLDRMGWSIEQALLTPTKRRGLNVRVAAGYYDTSKRQSRTPEYAAWAKMKDRCNSPKALTYADYGGRGIKVCERWNHNFAAFLEDLGPRPSPLYSLDRIDVNGNYEPSNCRWADKAVQIRNRRNTRYLTFKGETLCLWDWAVRLGTTSPTLLRRLKSGWSVEATLSTPVRKQRRFE